MQEIFEKLNKQNQTEKTEIEFETNPQNILGGSITKEHRLIYFKKSQPQNLYIDFNVNKILSNKIFVVPAGHLLYLPPILSDFGCVTFPTSSLNEMEIFWFLSKKYLADKSMDFQMNNLNFEINDRKCNRLSAFLNTEIQYSPNEISIQYIKQADKLCSALFETLITHTFTVTDLANSIANSHKTLYRICSNIFSVKPQHIIHYHLMVKILVYIIDNKGISLHIISEELGFKNTSAFARFTKAFTGLSPKEIREIYFRLHL